MRVLVTRPLRDAQTTAARLADHRHVGIVAPVLRLEACVGAIPEGPFAAILATSVHALEFLDDSTIDRMRHLPLYCVGARAAALATRRGFENVAPPAANVAGLLATLPVSPGEGKLLYPAGHDRKPFLETELARRGFTIAVSEIYKAAAETRLTPAALSALEADAIDAVFTYSRRSGEVLIALAREAGVLDRLLTIKHVCISADAAAPFTALGARTFIAASANSAGMMAALNQI